MKEAVRLSIFVLLLCVGTSLMAQSPEGNANEENGLAYASSKEEKSPSNSTKQTTKSVKNSKHDMALEQLLIAETRIVQLEKSIEAGISDGSMSDDQIRRKTIALKEAKRLLEVYKAKNGLTQTRL